MVSHMNQETFNSVLDRRITLCREVLSGKSKEYARDEDKLHNFKRAALLENCTPEKALRGMFTKHIISVYDIIDDIEKGTIPTQHLLDEKIGDSINYLILLEALVNERHREGK